MYNSAGLAAVGSPAVTVGSLAASGDVMLDQLGITEPVDWVGNAWGGHVGITLTVAQPHRLRSLVTIAAPVTPVSGRQRWTKTYPLALLYRLLGPNRLLIKILFDELLGSEAIAAHPDRVAEMMSAFRAADRESIWRTIRFMHSWRAPSLTNSPLSPFPPC
jgi:pimeloyl-ACP methyl ester carboxylesterase